MLKTLHRGTKGGGGLDPHPLAGSTHVYKMIPSQGLGPTVKELDVSGLPVIAKTRFSMMVPEVQEHLKQLPGKAKVLARL